MLVAGCASTAGDNRYLMEVEQSRMHEVHLCNIQEYEEDPHGVPLKLYRYRQAVPASTVDKAARALVKGTGDTIEAEEEEEVNADMEPETLAGWPNKWEEPPEDSAVEE